MRPSDTRRRMSRDDGTTLIELMVGMTLMIVFMGMFTGAIVMMYGAMNKTQAMSVSASQLNIAFTNLDGIVRYAAAISTPAKGTTTGDWYVELRTTNTGSEVCTQLRVDITAQQLQQRTWKVTNGVASSLTNWVPIASGITNGGAATGPTTQPFYLKPPQANTLFQQLTLNLMSPAGPATSMTTSVSSFTLTAMDSLLPVPAGICQEQTRP